MEFYQLLSFGRQVGLAVMGAAALWGMVFLYIANKKHINDPAGIFMDWIGLRMRWLVLIGGAIGVITWLILTVLIPANAHEGVTLATTKASTINAMLLMTPLYLTIIATTLFSLFNIKKPSFLIGKKYGFSWFYPVAFIIASIGISYYTDLRGLPANEVIFHIFHGFHSVFTLGTVLCLDFIFLSTQNAPFVQKHVVPLFPQISKVIWVGLALDLMSTILIYQDAVTSTARFYFAQGVVVILVINGILLSGAITRRMLKNIEEGHKERTKHWQTIATIAGAISITSWMAITFVDQFHEMTVPLDVLFGVYLGVIAFIICTHKLWETYDKKAIEVYQNLKYKLQHIGE